MMSDMPRISVVTSSYNQGAFIGRTIESVLAQNYPNLEHIVVDGMSTDDTPEILARYPHLIVIREPDRGQAEAINKGFRIATGDIFCFLNSDDIFLPGALERVAREIDPARGRHIVMGRCRFIDEDDNFLGIEHPSGFSSHRQVLEIWNGYSIPQPAVFWTREVWQNCGPLNENEQLMLDYDLFCRFSKRYTFHFVDQALATYRLHTRSKTSSVTDAQRLEQAISVSRRYWGTPTELQFWQILGSYMLYRLARRQRAVALFRQAREAWRHGDRRQMALRGLLGAALAPDLVGDIVIVPALLPRVKWLLRYRPSWLRVLKPRQVSPHTLAWREFTRLHADGWAGPEWITDIEIAPGQHELQLVAETPLGNSARSFDIRIFIDGQLVSHRRVQQRSLFTLTADLRRFPPGVHQLRVVSSSYIVPHDLVGNQDYRPLAFRVKELRQSEDSEKDSG